MTRVGALIDDWKLPIFKKHLDRAGLAFTRQTSTTPNVWVLAIATDNVLHVRAVLAAANKEAGQKNDNVNRN